MDGKPAASAVVLNWNGGNEVLRCLRSIANQDFASFEIIVVDNASSDGSPSLIAEEFPRVKLLGLESNHGYTGGMNAGIHAATSDYVFTCNFDIELEPDYVRRCVEAMEINSDWGGTTGKLLKPGAQNPAILDTTGHVVYRNRRAVDRGHGEADSGQYDGATLLFGVPGAAPCLRKTMLDDIRLDDQYFEESFFAYFEDFDLCWRAQLKGWRFGFVPRAVGRHRREGSGAKQSTFILACNHRNRLLTIVRNDDPRSFLRHFGGIAYTELRATLHMLRRRPSALFLAWGQFFKLLPGQWKKRKRIQRERTKGWRELEQWFKPYKYGPRATFQRARERAAQSAPSGASPK